MDRLTTKQMDVFKRVINGDKPTQIAKDIGITREAVYYRMEGLVKKGYLVKNKEEGAYFKDVEITPTTEGLEKIMKDNTTKHSYWDNVRVIGD